MAGAALSGAITLRDLDTDPVVDHALGMQHLDSTQLLGASGLAVPDSLGMAPGVDRDLAYAKVGRTGCLSLPISEHQNQSFVFYMNGSGEQCVLGIGQILGLQCVAR